MQRLPEMEIIYNGVLCECGHKTATVAFTCDDEPHSVAAITIHHKKGPGKLWHHE